jgi:hypothetical protein
MSRIAIEGNIAIYIHGLYFFPVRSVQGKF